MNTTELCPSPVLGPSRKNRLGTSATVMPRCATIPSRFHRSTRSSPRGALDVEVGVPVGHVEAGGADDGIDFALGAVDGDDAVAGHPRDAVGDHFGLGVGDGLIEVVRDQDSLTAGAVRRRQLGAQRRGP